MLVGLSCPFLQCLIVQDWAAVLPYLLQGLKLHMEHTYARDFAYIAYNLHLFVAIRRLGTHT